MRAPRREESGAIHHVVAQGVGRRPIVIDDTDRIALAGRLEATARALAWRVPAWCLLDTHLHGVVQTPEPTLGEGMKRIKGAHALAFNRRHGLESHVFAQRYWSRRIENETYLLTACVYVVVNPVAAGLCAHPAEWRWSSYLRTAHGDPASLDTSEALLLGLLGNSPQEARSAYVEIVTAAAALAVERRDAERRELWDAVTKLARGERP